MCHSFSFHTVVLSPISGATLFRTPLLISLICLFQLIFYVLWLFPIFPLSSTLPHCILFVFHIAIAAVESPLIFETKSQCRDKNTCCCRYVLIWFLLPLSFSGCSDFSFVLFFYTISGNKTFLCIPFAYSLALNFHLCFSLHPSFTLIFSPACTVLSGSLMTAFCCRRQNCLPFSNFESSTLHLLTTVPMKNTVQVPLKSCSTFMNLLKMTLRRNCVCLFSSGFIQSSKDKLRALCRYQTLDMH